MTTKPTKNDTHIVETPYYDVSTRPTYTPAIRFPDFLNDGEWKVKRLGEIAEIFQGYGFPEKLQGKTKGKYPFIKVSDISAAANKGCRYISKALNYIDEEDLSAIKARPFPKRTIVFAKIGEAIKLNRRVILEQESLIDNNVAGIKAIPNLLDDEFLFCIMLMIDLVKYAGGVVPAVKKSSIEGIEVLVPPLAEQHRIAQSLTALDDLIVATNEKLEQMKAYKKGLMQKLFPAKGKKLPELRFKEFEKDGEWQVKTLGEGTKVVNRRNKSNRNLPIYSISNKDGFIPQSEQFDGIDGIRRGYDISSYKLVTSNTFAYNPARINIGSIGYSGNIRECIVSPSYVCFKSTEGFDDIFLLYFFATYYFRQNVENNVEGGVRSCLFYENFSRIKIMFPSVSEQKRIASCLQAADEEIDSLSRKAFELKMQKTGMMQLMFPPK